MWKCQHAGYGTWPQEKEKKDVEKVITPKANMVVDYLYVAGWRTHDNHGNK